MLLQLNLIYVCAQDYYLNIQYCKHIMKGDGQCTRGFTVTLKAVLKRQHLLKVLMILPTSFDRSPRKLARRKSVQCSVGNQIQKIYSLYYVCESFTQGPSQSWSQRDLGSSASSKLLAPGKFHKKSRSFCEQKNINTTDKTAENLFLRTPFQIFPYAIKESSEETDASPESRGKIETMMASPRNFAKTEKEGVVEYNFWDSKEGYPKIIITQYDQQLEYGASEGEKLEGGKKRKPYLFAGFNERHLEKKKEIEQQTTREKQLEEASMDKHPNSIQRNTRVYVKSTFCTTQETVLMELDQDLEPTGQQWQFQQLQVYIKFSFNIMQQFVIELLLIMHFICVILVYQSSVFIKRNNKAINGEKDSFTSSHFLGCNAWLLGLR
eukprot:TRINITY_DN88702_c1_g1_i1.p1 TRINITY_DN88702_c1_g1~~TRINITY_DN88702_c1_g1_i1.p1  ORF type:complete len:380 (+),score=7.30 TRINITY_DN88702_c1_g1_i1:66-1205(+)